MKKTLKNAKVILSEIGMGITKRDDEYRVNFKNGTENTAYYTNDLQDALETGMKMAGYVKAGK